MLQEIPGAHWFKPSPSALASANLICIQHLTETNLVSTPQVLNNWNHGNQCEQGNLEKV
jgi:hypothetical protein